MTIIKRNSHLNKKILIVGLGYVGSSAKKMFERRYQVETVDPDRKKKADYKKIPDKKYHLAVVCVPTNSKANGNGDISIVKKVVGKINAKVILIKSTIPPKTTDLLKEFYEKRIVFSPEYIGQGSYHTTYQFHKEMYKTPWWVLGGDDQDCDYVKDIILPIVGPQKKWFYLSALEAELVKYMENFYFAMKVTFANEIYEVCQEFGVSYEKIRQAWGADPRVDTMHTAVFKDSRGFKNSHCFEKDTKAFINAIKKDSDYNPQFLIDIIKNNQKFSEINSKKDQENKNR